MSSTQQKMQQLLTRAEVHLHRMFLAGCVFGALSCFARADFNLPLYAFLYIMWDQDDVSDPPTVQRSCSSSNGNLLARET